MFHSLYLKLSFQRKASNLEPPKCLHKSIPKCLHAALEWTPKHLRRFRARFFVTRPARLGRSLRAGDFTRGVGAAVWRRVRHARGSLARRSGGRRRDAATKVFGQGAVGVSLEASSPRVEHLEQFEAPQLRRCRPCSRCCLNADGLPCFLSANEGGRL